MAHITQWTRDGDRVDFESSDPGVIREAENAHTDDSTNIAHTRVVE